MVLKIEEKKPLFRRRRPQDNPYRVVVLAFLILGGMLLLRAYDARAIQPLFMPTPTPTRAANSYALEAETQFFAGNLGAAIEAYQKAVQIDPQNARLYAELARIQTYSSSLLTTDAERKTRLQEALQNINKAAELNPDDTLVHAIRAFVLDWNANPVLAGEEAPRLLVEAEQAALRALQLDSQNALALAYYAEVLVDQQKWGQAEEYIQIALQRDPSLMDVHRVSGYVQESLSNYEGAIQEYLQAIKITPNFTPLYISIGANLRQLKRYDEALEYFAKAVEINQRLGVKDPIPYLSIAKTYSQKGEFFAAALNVRAALEMIPDNPDVYGQLGMVYFKSRNYESAIPALKCAVRGCSAEESCEVRRCNPETDRPTAIQGLPLSDSTVVYYYTYGAALAGMHRPSNNYCAEAMQVLAEVRQAYAQDTVVMGIVEPSERICESFGYTRP
ncbi:tetratricopeptide repeat protein [Thermanaerothrix sp.]|jgi:tetratricopeptide (TPR) repeat protein|uniref:tetratricopeptide repeat protein n=1 Tax=Thermanaerothrix sp. TaxID=2972675 RepID=UPI002ADE3701|nr:tetratricopeptide repeat protein [Thermanaerothrix sp.]